jgi:hypothetical protein
MFVFCTWAARATILTTEERSFFTAVSFFVQSFACLFYKQDTECYSGIMFITIITKIKVQTIKK